MAKLGSLVYDLVANTANFERGLTKAEATARRRSSAIEKRFKRMSRTIATAFGAAAIIQGVRKTVSAFADFEQGLVAVGKTANIEGEALQQLGKGIQDISLVVPIAVTELLRIASAAGQVGVKGTENILAFTETLGRLSLATDVIGDEGAKSIARLLTVTQEGVGNVAQFGNVLTRLGNDAAASESEILEMATSIGQATALFGVSSSEALALGAAFKGVGLQAEKTGTVLGTTFLALSQATAKGGKDLQLIADVAGMTADEFQKLFSESSTRGFVAFQTGLGNLAGGANEVADVLGKLGLSGKRPIAVLGTMATAATELEKQFKTMNDELEQNDALLVESVKAAQTFTSKMTLLGNAANVAAKELGNLIAPVLLSGMQALSAASLALADNVELLKDAFKIAAAVVAGKFIGAMGRGTASIFYSTAAAERNTAGMIAMSLGLRAAGASAVFLKRALAFFGGPLGLLITGVSTAFILLSGHTKSAAEATDTYSEAMMFANQLGKEASKINRENAEFKRLETIETLELALAEQKLALARNVAARGIGRIAAERNRADLRVMVAETQAALDKIKNFVAPKITPPTTPTPVSVLGGGETDSTKQLKKLQDITRELTRQRDLAEARLGGYERELLILHEIEDAAKSVGRELTAAEKGKIEGLIVDRELMKIRLEEIERLSQETFEEISTFAEQAASRMQDAFADFLFDPFDQGLKGMLHSFVQMINRMVAEAIAADLASKLLGTGQPGGGSGIMDFVKFGASLFGGPQKLAGGGTLAAGEPAIVGEQGQELFVPKTAGTIIPNNQLGGSTVNMTVITPNADSFRRSERQIASDQSRLLDQARSFA